MFGTPPHVYETWPAKSRALAESLVELDASTNEYGIPLEQARDEDLGWDVTFPVDYSVAEVARMVEHSFGAEGMPAGAKPVVKLNPNTWNRVQAQREAQAARERDSASEKAGRAH